MIKIHKNNHSISHIYIGIQSALSRIWEDIHFRVRVPTVVWVRMWSRPLIFIRIEPPLFELVVPVSFIYEDAFVDVDCIMILIGLYGDGFNSLNSFITAGKSYCISIWVLCVQNHCFYQTSSSALSFCSTKVILCILIISWSTTFGPST